LSQVAQTLHGASPESSDLIDEFLTANVHSVVVMRPRIPANQGWRQTDFVGDKAAWRRVELAGANSWARLHRMSNKNADTGLSCGSVSSVVSKCGIAVTMAATD